MNNEILTKLKDPKNRRKVIMFFCLALAVVLLYTYVVWYVTMFIAAEQFLTRDDIALRMSLGAYATEGRYILTDMDCDSDGVMLNNMGYFRLPKWRVKRLVKKLAAAKYGEENVDFDGIEIVSMYVQDYPDTLPLPYRYEYLVLAIIPREGVENPEEEPLFLLRRW